MMLRATAWLTVALPLAAQQVVAHRGGAPENSLQGIRKSLALGVRVEIDVRETKDGKLVLMHDQTVERTMPGEGRVRELTQAQVAAIGLPTLEDALATGAIPDIDFKAGEADALVAALRRFDLLERATVSSEGPDTVRRLRALVPAMRLRLPLPSGRNGLAVLIAESNPSIVTVEWAQFRPELVEEIHALGREVFLSVLGPGDVERSWRAAAAARVEYLETDHPDLVLRVLGR